MHLFNISNADRIIQLAITFNKAYITLPRTGTVTEYIHENLSSYCAQ